MIVGLILHIRSYKIVEKYIWFFTNWNLVFMNFYFIISFSVAVYGMKKTNESSLPSFITFISANKYLKSTFVSYKRIFKYKLFHD